MTSLRTFLELYSNAPGLPGPILREVLAAYKVFDDMPLRRPQIVATIGGWVKRQYTTRNMLISTTPSTGHSMAFASLNTSTLLLDCELHDIPLPRLEPGFRTEGSNLHTLKTGHMSARELLCDIYSSVLALFSDTILIFVPDFGGVEQVRAFLCSWMRNAIKRKFPRRSRLILVHHDRLANFESELSAFFLATCVDPTESYTTSNIRQLTKRCFRICTVELQGNVGKHIQAELEASAKDRLNEGLHFNAVHIKALLQRAIIQYVQEPSASFDYIKASRVAYELPIRMKENVKAFLENHNAWNIMVEALASSIVMDAYPPGMHFFPPKSVFTLLYREAIDECEISLKMTGLTQAVETEFVRVSLNFFHAKDDPGISHHAKIDKLKAWEGSCSFCILQTARYTLDCQHRFCEVCAIQHGSNEGFSGRHSLSICPRCKAKNTATAILQPPTAVQRVLELSGSNPETIVSFIRTLRCKVGLNSVALKDQFDEIVGSDLGCFFVITLFLEKWNLADCVYHLHNLRRVKLRNKTIRFGKNLTWDLTNPKIFNNTLVTLKTNKGLLTSIDRVLSDQPRVVVQNESCSEDTFDSISGSLQASLFYIELVRLPRFYVLPEYCALYIKCRLPPGHGLLDLLFKLNRSKMYLHYQGDEATEKTIPLCTEDAIERCRRFEPFVREIQVRLSSPQTRIRIQINDMRGKRHNISRCPYMISELIKDQGLDCPFGKRNTFHQVEESNIHGTLEIERLLKRLKKS